MHQENPDSGLSEDSRNPRLQTFTTRYKIIVLVSITLARVIYSLNWFDLSPGLPQVAADFHASLTSLGILESSFLVGAGLFQIPSSYLSTRWNSKALVVGGLALIAFSNALASFADSFIMLIALRFSLGVGASMFFSPAIAVVAPLFKSERQGAAIGVYNSAFSIGGVLGLFAWNYFVQAYSWRVGLLIGAILCGAFAIENYIVIKHKEVYRAKGAAEARVALKGVLKDKQTWLLGVGILGVWSGYYIATQFVPYFEITQRSVDPYIAGLLASLISIMPIPGSIIGGWLSDRFRNRKLFMLIPGIVFSITVGLVGTLNLSQTFLIIGLAGLMDSFIMSALYAAPFQMEHLAPNQKAISISLMNSIQISGAFFTPILFSVVATVAGYPPAWAIVGIFSITFVPLIAFAREPFKK